MQKTIHMQATEKKKIFLCWNYEILPFVRFEITWSGWINLIIFSCISIKYSPFLHYVSYFFSHQKGLKSEIFLPTEFRWKIATAWSESFISGVQGDYKGASESHPNTLLWKPIKTQTACPKNYQKLRIYLGLTKGKLGYLIRTHNISWKIQNQQFKSNDGIKFSKAFQILKCQSNRYILVGYMATKLVSKSHRKVIKPKAQKEETDSED